MILLPKIPKTRLMACAAATALSFAMFLSSNSLNELRAQAWLDIHGHRLPPVPSEIRKKWSSTDREIYEIMHPPPRHGLVGVGSVPERHLYLCKTLLKLPIAASGDEVRDTIYRRLAKLREHGVPDRIYEAQQITGVSDSNDEDLLKTRMYFLDSCLATYMETDIRLGTHCAGFEWNSPFRLVAEKKLAEEMRAKLIDDLTFNLL